MIWERLPDRQVGPGGRAAAGAGDRGGESRQRLVAPPPRQHRQPGRVQDIAGDSVPRGPRPGQDWFLLRLFRKRTAQFQLKISGLIITRKCWHFTLVCFCRFDVNRQLFKAEDLFGAGLQHLKPKEWPQCLETRGRRSWSRTCKRSCNCLTRSVPATSPTLPRCRSYSPTRTSSSSGPCTRTASCCRGWTGRWEEECSVYSYSAVITLKLCQDVAGGHRQGRGDGWVEELWSPIKFFLFWIINSLMIMW